MKKWLPLALVPLLLTSCTAYQFITVSSNQMDINPRHEFVSQNDSILVIYNFNGQNAPVNIVVKNYLNTPVYVDWKSSSMVINGKSYSYMDASPIRIAGAFSSDSYRAGRLWIKRGMYDNDNTITSGTFNATVTVPDNMAFIPGNSYITKTAMDVSDQFIYGVPDSAYHKKSMVLVDGSNENIKQAVFSEDNSPMHFTSYIAVRVGDPSEKPVIYKHSFYVSAISKTKEDPFTFGYAEGSEGDRFYVRGEPSN
jgi:hypothetical protein